VEEVEETTVETADAATITLVVTAVTEEMAAQAVTAEAIEVNY